MSDRTERPRPRRVVLIVVDKLDPWRKQEWTLPYERHRAAKGYYSRQSKDLLMVTTLTWDIPAWRWERRARLIP